MKKIDEIAASSRTGERLENVVGTGVDVDIDELTAYVSGDFACVLVTCCCSGFKYFI